MQNTNDRSVSIKAYAKVNLGLDIVGRREDGYHLVKMIMQTVDILDILTFTKKEEKGITIKLKDSEASELSLGEDNLIYKAVKLMMDSYQLPGGVEVILEKNIPIAAGMAGGSSDCAASLKAVNELYDLKLSEQELRDVGIRLGADVPFCIMGGTAISEGIGEKLTKLPASDALKSCTFLIVKPAEGVSTAEAYRAYDSLSQDQVEHPDIDGMAEAIRNDSLDGVTARLGNVLEYVTAEKLPEIKRLEELMLEAGAENSIMSGSGPTVFGIFRDKDSAWKCAEIIRETGLVKDIFAVGTGE